MGTSPGPDAAHPDPNAAFLNVPYDEEFEPLYLAFIAGLCALRLRPRATLEIPGSERRLDRIFELLRICRYSFHDLSRVELDPRRPHVPRFNMPFELGLVVGAARAARWKHDWFVFEAKHNRPLKSLSDLNGTEFYIHGARPLGVLRCLANALPRAQQRPDLDDLKAVHGDIRRAARKLKRDWGTLFDTRPFGELVFAGTDSARKRIPSG